MEILTTIVVIFGIAVISVCAMSAFFGEALVDSIEPR